MNAIVPGDILVDRPEVAAEIDAAIRGINADEANRRRRRWLLDVAPWLGMAICVGFAGNAGYILAHRPIPKPEMHVAIYRSDGTVEAPVERDKSLSIERKTFIIRADLKRFIEGWENYAWGANQGYYNRVSAMTAGEKLQQSYQESWSKHSSPENRDAKYGKDVTRYVVQSQVAPLPGAPYSLTGRALIKTTKPDGAVCEWWQVDLTWKPDNGMIPADVQETYDPSDTIVRTYSSTPSDPSRKPWSC